MCNICFAREHSLTHSHTHGSYLFDGKKPKKKSLQMLSELLNANYFHFVLYSFALVLILILIFTAAVASDGMIAG